MLKSVRRTIEIVVFSGGADIQPSVSRTTDAFAKMIPPMIGRGIENRFEFVDGKAGTFELAKPGFMKN